MKFTEQVTVKKTEQTKFAGKPLAELLTTATAGYFHHLDLPGEFVRGLVVGDRVTLTFETDVPEPSSAVAKLTHSLALERTASRQRALIVAQTVVILVLLYFVFLKGHP